MVIYTKRGDKGKTSLYDDASSQRVRVSKSSLSVEALGAIDELNSFLGVTKTFYKDNKNSNLISDIQKNLLTIGSILAGSKLRFSKTNTKHLERLIDDLEGELPVLKNFVIPGGSSLSAHLQYSRSLTRRAERRVVALSEITKVKPQVLEYLNRLSDFLFMLARKANFEAKFKEEVWIGRKKR